VSVKAKDSRRDRIAMVVIAKEPAIDLAGSHLGLDRFDIGHENIFAGTILTAGTGTFKLAA
jgi:hypothetical protein